MRSLSRLAAPLLLVLSEARAFAPPIKVAAPFATARSFRQLLYSSNKKDKLDDGLGERFGGYTVKQRLREEVESPFRTVRLYFFGTSAASALVALYFSALNVLKAYSGFEGAPLLEESLQSCAINAGGFALCAGLAYRDWVAGEANLARIAKGGALARLRVSPAASGETTRTLKDYRRLSRVLIAAGGPAYVEELARSLNADQLQDVNTLPQALEEADMVVVPVLLKNDDTVGDTRTCWVETTPQEGDRNFDITRANNVLAFPNGMGAWSEYLQDELDTAKKQGFDVVEKGITITVKKNGRILRRTTGQPPWSGIVGTMEVMDGSKFGMPGDSEKYGGP